jgi:DNA-binding NarL/FixJ family response regulator
MSDEENKPIRLLICDDQDIVCEGLRAIFSSVPQIEVVGIANNGIEAIEQTRYLQPDLVLMDLKMPKMNGIKATRAIHEQFPSVYVLVLTTYDADEWVMDAIRSGAAGYLLKDTPQEDLIKAIMNTVNGHTHLDPHVARIVLDHVVHQPVVSSLPEPQLISQLSDREREVLRYLASGLSNTEISQTLYLTEGTVKNYVSTIFSKLEVTDRTQAALLAIRAGLVKPGSS